MNHIFDDSYFLGVQTTIDNNLRLSENYSLMCEKLLESVQPEIDTLFNELDIAKTFAKHNDLLNEGIVDAAKLKAKSAKQKLNRVERKVDNNTINFIKGVEKDIKEDIREKQIKRIPFKVSKIVKKATIMGVAWAINPAIAALGLIVSLNVSKHLTAREKDRLINELRDELDIVEEKIKDAEANNDRDKKYQLIRLRNEIKRSMMKITSGTNASLYIKNK